MEMRKDKGGWGWEIRKGDSEKGKGKRKWRGKRKGEGGKAKRKMKGGGKGERNGGTGKWKIRVGGKMLLFPDQKT